MNNRDYPTLHLDTNLRNGTTLFTVVHSHNIEFNN